MRSDHTAPNLPSTDPIPRSPTPPTAPTRLEAARRGFLQHWPWLLVLSILPLFETGAAFHVPLGAMVLIGAALLVRRFRPLRNDPGVRFIVVVFLALWVPQLIALPGAADLDASLRAALRYLLYPPAAVFIMIAMRQEGHFGRFALGAAAIIGVWSLDHALGGAGLDLFDARDPDIPYWGGTLFVRDTLAHISAAMSPLIFELVRRRHRQAPWIWLAPVLLLLLVLISGRRVAWMMLAVAVVLYLGYLAFFARQRIRWARVLVSGALMAAAAAAVYTQHDLTRERVDLTLDLFSEEREEVDIGTSYRLDIWSTSARIASAYWPLGAGALGTRTLYAEYAAPDDHWVANGYTRMYPHQFALEIVAETGLAGLFGYLLALTAVGYAVARSRHPWSWACGIGLIVVMFPLNAHISFYGSYGSMQVWWLVGLTAAAIRTGAAAEKPVNVGSTPAR